jgi:hypothetical protein
MDTEGRRGRDVCRPRQALSVTSGVFRMVAPPEVLLGTLGYLHLEVAEVLIDPELLGDVELTGIEPQATPATALVGGGAPLALRRFGAAAGRGQSGFDLIHGR